jgi:hypothetical protein
LLACVNVPRWVKLALFAALAAATGALTVPDFVTQQLAWRVALGAAVFVLCLGQDAVARRLPGLALPLAWIVTGSAAVPILIASANAKFAFFSTAVAAAAGACCVAWLVLRRDWVPRSAVPVVAVALPVLLAAGYFNDYGGVPWPSFALATFAPLALLIASWLSRAPSHPVRVTLCGVCGVIVICSAALALAWPALTRQPAW